MQKTLTSPAMLDGIALHSGRCVRVALHAAPEDHGIVFHRTDIQLGDRAIPARWDRVCDTTLCTRIGNRAGVTVGTVEHLMAALWACGVTNARVEVDGPELPILDGSALPWVAAIRAAGVAPQLAPVATIRIRKRVSVTLGSARAWLEPSARPEIRFRIDFADAAIGSQSARLALTPDRVADHLADARTFCRLRDVAAMRARGLALGGSPDNAVVVDGADVLGTGLRHPDEPVRHKMLDAVGDLALAGAPILGRYTGLRAGHAVTNALLRRLFADPTAWVIDAAAAVPDTSVAAVA